MNGKLRIERWPLDKLKTYPHNPRRHPSAQIDALVKAMKRTGFDVPIVVDKEGVVIKGHGRLLAAKKLELETVPVVVRDDLSPARVREARIADNRLSELGKWDEDVLSGEVSDSIEEFGEDFDVEALAFPDDKFLTESDDEEELDEKPRKMKLTKFVTCPKCEHEFEA